MPRQENFEREKVLTKTTVLFWEKGYHGTSMQDLVDATGLNRSSIYNSFGSKLDLYLLSLKTYQKNQRALLQGILVKAGNPREALQLIFGRIISQTLLKEAPSGCFEINSLNEMAPHDPNVKQVLWQSKDQQIDFFEHLIRDGQKRGLINERQTANEYGYLIFNAYQGLKATGVWIEDKPTLQILAQNILRILM